jgi:hypothetical protein
MPEPRVVTAAERDLLVGMRLGGARWDDIAAALRCSRWRVIEEAKDLGLPTGPFPVVRSPRAVRNDYKKEPLPAWNAVSRGVLADAGLPVPRVGEVWL